jgi:hypothetical protein
VSIFRPARTVSGPAGEYWELYVSKTALPAWREGRSSDSGDGAWGSSPGALLDLPFAVLSFLWSCLVFPLMRALALLPFAVIRGKRSRAVRIEALNPFPQRVVLLWTTTDGQVDRVLDEIAAGLAQGKVVHPLGAVYSGAE